MSLSYWLDRPYEPGPPLIGRRSADAAVIGAGITGIGLARCLSARKVKVVVLERDTIAGGASGRNAGFLVSGLGEHYARSVEFWGRTAAKAITRFHLQNHALIADCIAEHEIDCNHARDGCFVIASDSAEEDLLRESGRLQLEDGFRCEFIEASEIARILGTRGFLGGLLNCLDGYVDPVRLTRGIAAAVQRSGCEISEHTRVECIRQSGASYVLETERGAVTTPLVFLAANAWTPSLLPEMALQPVRGQCLALGPLDAPAPPLPCYTNYGSEYWRGSGRYLLLGGMRRSGKAGEIGCDEAISEPVQTALDRYRSEHFPTLSGAPVAYRWSGIMSYSIDGLPLVGAVPGRKGMFLAAGYTGHGLGWALLAARWLVCLAIDGIDEIPGLCRLEREMRRSPSLEEI